MFARPENVPGWQQQSPGESGQIPGCRHSAWPPAAMKLPPGQAGSHERQRSVHGCCSNTDGCSIAVLMLLWPPLQTLQPLHSRPCKPVPWLQQLLLQHSQSSHSPRLRQQRLRLPRSHGSVATAATPRPRGRCNTAARRPLPPHDRGRSSLIFCFWLLSNLLGKSICTAKCKASELKFDEPPQPGLV